MTFAKLFPGRGTTRDRIRNAWATAYQRADERGAWDPADVRERLEEAVKVAQHAGGPVGPKMFGSAWPEMRKEWGDAVAQVDSGEPEPPPVKPRQRRAITTAQITRAESGLRWQALYLDHDELSRVRHGLRVWMVCRAHRRPFRPACQALGLDYSTMKRACHDAYLAIAVGLMRDGVELDADTVERKASPERNRATQDDDEAVEEAA